MIHYIFFIVLENSHCHTTIVGSGSYWVRRFLFLPVFFSIDDPLVNHSLIKYHRYELLAHRLIV